MKKIIGTIEYRYYILWSRIVYSTLFTLRVHLEIIIISACIKFREVILIISTNFVVLLDDKLVLITSFTNQDLQFARINQEFRCTRVQEAFRLIQDVEC